MQIYYSASFPLSVQGLIFTEAAFIATYAFLLLNTPSKATSKRVIGLLVLGTATWMLEKSLVQRCMDNKRPHWAAIITAFLWVQLAHASDLLLVRGVDSAKLSTYGGSKNKYRAISSSAPKSTVVALLFNSRRIGTPWQVKNVPSTTSLEGESRTTFILRRSAILLLAYLFVDIMVSLPAPDPVFVRADKATFFPDFYGPSAVDNTIFRVATTVSFWLTTGIVVIATNNLYAILAVASGLSRPVDCPPPLGSFLDSFTVRRFWGQSWHQMLRSPLTGHANLIVDKLLPSLSPHSKISRYTRLTIAFAISGVIHWRADQAQGVPDAENGALIFFLLHAAVIMLEDAIGPILGGLLPARGQHIMGYLWVLAFFAWSSPVYMYPAMRLGYDGAGLLPFRVIGPYLIKS